VLLRASKGARLPRLLFPSCNWRSANPGNAPSWYQLPHMVVVQSLDVACYCNRAGAAFNGGKKR